MQAFAAELGISETTFVAAARGRRRPRGCAIFTPARELPMAGHPIVGHGLGAPRARAASARRRRLETGAGTAAGARAGRRRHDGPGAAARPGPPSTARRSGRPAGRGRGRRRRPRGLEHRRAPAHARVAGPGGAGGGPARRRGARRLGERDGWIGVSIYALTAASRAPAAGAGAPLRPAGRACPRTRSPGSAAGGARAPAWRRPGWATATATSRWWSSRALELGPAGRGRGAGRRARRGAAAGAGRRARGPALRGPGARGRLTAPARGRPGPTGLA